MQRSMRFHFIQAARRLGLAALLLASASSLPAQLSVSGTVLDTSDHPVSGARVELLPVLSNFDAGRLRNEGQNPQPVATGISDGTGRFLVRAPGIGVFKLSVRAEGKMPMQDASIPLVDDLELPPAALLADAGARLLVADSAGRPLSGAWVFAAGSGERDELKAGDGWRIDARIGRTGEDGSLILPRIAGEKLNVSVFPPGGAEERKLDFDGGTITIPAPLGEPCGLHVLTVEGQPAAGILVRIGDLAWPAGLTDGEGRLQIPRRPGETAKVRLLAPDGRQQSVELAANPGRAEEVSITFSAPRIVSGRVTSGAEPLSGALVRTTADPGAFVITDANGLYRLVAPSGRFQLQAVAPRHLPRTALVTGSHLRSGRAPSLALARVAAIGGQVVDLRGVPLTGVALAAVPEPAPGLPDAVVDRMSSDGAGRFKLRRLQAGRGYRVQANRPGYLSAAVPAVAPEPSREAPPLKIILAPARAVQGRVRDAAGHPVPGVEILLNPSQAAGAPAGTTRPVKGRPGAGEEPPTTRSDEQGRFAFAQIPANPLDLMARKPGFAPALVRGIRVPAGAGAADLGPVVLRPGARLRGQVADRNGRPVAGAEIFRVESLRNLDELSSRLEGKKADADSRQDGSFVLEDLPQGSPVNLLIRGRGYQPAGVRGVRAPNQNPVAVRLEPSALLRGRIFDEARQPIGGARVGLTVHVRPPVSRTAVSDREGCFEIGNVPAGPALLDIDAQSFVSVEDLETTIPTRPGEDLTITLKRGAILAGHVSTTDGAPVSGARISATGATAVSDDEGSYSMEGVALGQTVVEVFHPSYQRFRKETVIEAGTNRLDVTFEPGVQVAGQIVDEQGMPVPGAGVELSLARGGQKYRGWTAADGTFSLSPVAQGRYLLSARHESYSPAELKNPVVVADEPVSGLELALRQGGAIVGRILGLASEELAQVEVEVSGVRRISPAALDSQGRYEIRHLEPGDYLIRAFLTAGQHQTQARVALEPGAGEVQRDLEFSRRLSLSGQVLYEEEPLPEAQVSVRGHHLAVERRVTTDYLGQFRIEDLEPDTYWLGLTHPRQPLVHNDTIELAGDRDIVIQLRAATVNGLVLDAKDQRPISRAVVLLRPDSGPEFLLSGSTGENGDFLLSHVPPGSYRLTARAMGYAPGERQVTVTAGQESTGLEMALTPTRGLDLSVRLASGGVPEMVHVRVLGTGGSVILAETLVPDPSGALRLSMVPEGDWSLLLSAPGGAVVGSLVTVPGEPRTVTLPTAGSLHVRVPALVSSDLIAAVTLRGVDQQAFWILGLGGAIQNQWPLVGGNTTIEGLPAGLWQIRVETPDGRTWTGKVTTLGSSDAGMVLE